MLGLVTSVLVLRGTDLTRLMVTLGVASILYEIANRYSDLTGGADGLQGVVIGPLLGRFEFGLDGRTAYIYSLTVLFLLFLVARKVVHSPFGYALMAIRDNRTRAAAIGIDANRRLATVYTLSAAMAGAAGALLAQTTGFASLDVLDFHRSADVLLVLVIGGTGYLYGGVLGAVLFRVMQDALSAATPQYWQFWIGLILDRHRARRPRAHRAAVAPARPLAFAAGAAMSAPLSTHGLSKSFGGIVATRDVSMSLAAGARHALIGPNGAGKTTFVNLLTGVLEPSAGTIELGGVDITQLPAHRRAQRGLLRTFQINQLFARFTPLESLALVIAQRDGIGARMLRAARTACGGRRGSGRDGLRSSILRTSCIARSASSRTAGVAWSRS